MDVSGRLIGGCLEVLAPLAGTPYADVPAYGRAHADEGLLVYLEVCEYGAYDACRLFHGLRYAGWFEHANAVLVGRTPAEDKPRLTQLRRSRTRSATSASRWSPRWTSATPSRSCRWSTAPRRGWSCGDGVREVDPDRWASGRAPASRPGRGRPGRAPSGPRDARWGPRAPDRRRGSSRAVVPEPVLAGLEALDHRVPGGREVRGGVLGRGGVAAADVAALGAAAQVHPPAAGRVALGAAGAARRDGGVDGIASCACGTSAVGVPRLRRGLEPLVDEPGQPEDDQEERRDAHDGDDDARDPVLLAVVEERVGVPAADARRRRASRRARRSARRAPT